MALDIPVGYGLCVVQHSVPFASQTQIVTWGFQDNTVDADPDTIATDIRSAWTGTGHPFEANLIADSTRLDSVKVYIRTEVGLVLGENTTLLNGTRATQPPSPQVACIVKKRTALVGRRYRGRFYLPASFLVAADVGPSGIIATPAVTSLQTRMNAFLEELSLALVPMVLLHTLAPFTPTFVTTLQPESLIGTQRRRVR